MGEKPLKSLADTLPPGEYVGLLAPGDDDHARERDQVLYHGVDRLPPEPYQLALSTGWPELDTHWKLRRGEFTVLTGVPGVGKSLFVKNLAMQMCMQHDWIATVACFEEMPRRGVVRTLVEHYVGRRLDNSSDRGIEQALDFVQTHFKFIDFNEADTLEPDLDTMLGLMAKSKYWGCHLIVIDPWNEMDHYRMRDETVTEYTGRAIKAFKRFAKSSDIHLIVVAHPTKLLGRDGKFSEMHSLYQISDSAHWTNKCDVGVILKKGDDANELRVKVAKVRHQEDIGKPGEIRLRFNEEIRRFECVPVESRAWK